MVAVNYSNKDVLIVDDLAQMRSSLKSMLDHFGVQHLETAVHGEEAINKLRNKSFNIVLCDYDLGRGKDGQQVLEECRAGGLLPASSVFIMITAAQTVEMVMGALEYEPDGYITKPVTLDSLHARLDKILKHKAIYREINQAIDAGDVDQAIENCNTLITVKPKFALPTYRIKGNLLLQCERLYEAEELYKMVLEIRDLAWAKLGLAKTYFLLEQYEEAKPLLEELAETSQRFVEAWDWLAKIYEHDGDLIKSEEMLVHAVERSPKAVLRQKELSRISRHNENWEVAVPSSRKAVSLGRNSCYKDPEAYFNLTDSLQYNVKKGGMREKAYATTEAVKTMQSVRKEYPDDAKIQTRSYLSESATYHNSGDKAERDSTMMKAKSVFRKHADQLGEEFLNKITDQLQEFGDEAGAKAFLEEPECKALVERLSKEKKGKAKKDHQLTEAEQQAKQELLENYNNEGVKLYEAGDLHEAVRVFRQAAEDPDASTSVLLNTIQALISNVQKEKEHPRANEYLDACEQYFGRLDHLEEGDQRYARFRKLKRIFNDLR